MYGKLTVGTLSLFAALNVACSSDGSDKSDTGKTTINWESCSDIETLQCAELEVPMDYKNPDSKRITLALIRKPSSNPDTRQSLLFNNGGPGGSGIAMLKSFHTRDSIPKELLSTYNLVSFDPRGVGKSTPVECAEFGLDEISSDPADKAAIELIHAQYTSYASACSEKYGDYLIHLGSLNVVRDMEEIRKALGEKKLNFVGYSYGTRLAALYLQEHPNSSGRMVLDAALNPDSSLQSMTRESLSAKESNLRLLFSQCAIYDPTCDAEALLATFNERIATLSSDTSIDAQMELELLSEFVSSAVAEPDFGELFAETLYYYLLNSDIALLLEFFNDPALQELFDPTQEKTDTTLRTAVYCSDDAFRPTPESLLNLLNEFKLISDNFAEGDIAYQAQCAGWPTSIEPLSPIATGVAPLSLVIGGTTDVLTPLGSSMSMAQAIGATFVRSEHPGHVSVFLGKSECVDDIVVDFLTNGLPPNITDCPAEKL